MIDRVLRTAAALACTAALLSPLPAVAAGDDAAALLAKHQAYVGWHIGDGVVKTLRATGTVTNGSKAVDNIVLLRYGVAERETTVDYRNLEYSVGFTGSVYWASGSNGFTVRPVGEVARYLIDSEALFGELTPQMTPALLRHEQVEGSDTVVLRLTSQVGFPMDVYVDPTTGAFKRVVIDPGGKYETFINGIAYSVVDGKRFLTAYHYYDSKNLISYTKVEINPTISPDDLRPPKQTASWTFGEGTAPIELTKNTFPRILIDVVMNGVKGKFILDTGAGGTAILDSFAREIGAKRFAASSIRGIGGSSPANLYRVDSISVGPSILHNVIVTSGLREEWKTQEGVVGLIGFDLLAGAIIDLDLDAGTLRVLDAAKVEPDQTKGIVVHADISRGQLRVPMKLNDKYDVIATLDSGNPLNVLFSRDLIYRDRMPFLVDPNTLGSTRYGGGVGSGYEIEQCGKLSSLQLGPIVYKPVPACDSDYESRNEILVGLDFMKAFNYVFDYPDGIIVMIPRKL
jgi:predicted aspartyl protease